MSVPMSLRGATIAGVRKIISLFSEPLTGHCAVIESDHAYIHAGKAWTVPLLKSSLAAGSAYNVSLRTPTAASGKFIHTRPTAITSSANLLRFNFYEGVAFTGGNPICPANRNRNSNSGNGSGLLVYEGTTAALTGTVAVNAVAGGNFGNQPAGGSVTIVSSNNVADKIPSATIYGTKTGATTTVTSEVIHLNGTTGVISTTTTWVNILGVELSAACEGTITLTKTAGGGTITTIAPAALSAGVVIPTDTLARNQIVRHDASGASTAPVGLIGINCYGAAASSVDALNGTTEEDHNADIFYTVTKVLVGAVASSVNVTILYPAKILRTTAMGSGGISVTRSGGNAGSAYEFVLLPDTDYLFYFKNVGETTATDVDIEIFFYEEDEGIIE